MGDHRPLAATLTLALAGLACSSTDGAKDGSGDAAAALRAPTPSAELRPASDPAPAPPSASFRPPSSPAPAPSLSAADPASAEPSETDAGQPVSYPLHGVTFHFLAHVYATPSLEAPTVGHLRRGARFRATERVEGDGCEGGWHGLAGEGFVCRGRGYLIGSQPRTFEPSPWPPSPEEPLPYRYAWVRHDDVPQYWELPTAVQQAEAAAWIESRSAGSDAGAPAGDGGTAMGADAGVRADASATDAGPERPPWLRLVMQRGFHLSVDREVSRADGETFVRTVRGAYVSADALVPVKPGPAPGEHLRAGRDLPVAFVHRQGPTRWRRVPTTGALRAAGRWERFASFPLAEVLERSRHTLVVARDGAMARVSAVRVAERRTRPEEVPASARWIHIRLSTQTLVAYEGDRPVFATLVSTGRSGFETPTGLHRIQSKHLTATMDDLSSEDPYLIEDVPWVMYFEGSYALHGAFWHSRFGHRRSHGCVNLAPGDARWLFRWSSPTVPPAWHGVMARGGREGTFLLVEP